jgi:dihydroorotase
MAHGSGGSSFPAPADAWREGASEWPAEVSLGRLADDFHVHLRDGAGLTSLGRCWSGQVKRALVMPNLRPPVTTVAEAEAYRARIVAAMPAGFEPLMTLYLTDRTSAEEVERAAASGIVHAVKLYPAGATTNSDSGVTDLERVWGALERMAEVGLPLCVHGEVTERAVDVFHRETVFLERVLSRIVERVPTLRVVLEHVTTRAAVDFVRRCGDNVAATITPQHLLYNRNALFEGGLHPHVHCLPVLKKEDDRRALVEAVASGSTKFFLGSDSAPHALPTKETACGCAGVFSAPMLLEYYAHALEREGVPVEHFVAFASTHGADFYRLPRNDPAAGVVRLRRTPSHVPASYPYAEHVVVPLLAEHSLPWTAAVEHPE